MLNLIAVIVVCATVIAVVSTICDAAIAIHERGGDR